MKKILLFASALAGLFFAASCQQENLEPVGGNTVTYTVQVPDALATKVIGEDVSEVTELIYEVHRTEAQRKDDHSQNETKLYQKTATLTNGVATVELELVNNQNFRVLFWAQVPGNGVYTTDDLKSVTLSQNLDANAENYAAYAGSDYIKYGDNLAGRTITLVRPVAQLNIATTSESLVLGEGAAVSTNVAVATTYVKVTGLSTTFNVSEGKAVYDPVAFEYEATDPSTLSEPTLEVNGKPYKYLSMNYVAFAEPTGSNVKVDYVIATSNVGNISNTISNVPVKPNYRTNIVGNLITSTSDYTITLEDKWAGVADEYEIWDGETKNEPKVVGGKYIIRKASEFAWLEAPQTLEYDVVLASDIDMGTNTFKGILSNGKSFDGAGHTLMNVKLDYTSEGQEWSSLFVTGGGGLANSKINVMDLIIDGAYVVASKSGNGNAAVIACFAEKEVVIENVKVRNSIVNGTQSIGALVGHVTGTGNATIKNCAIDNVTLSTFDVPGESGNIGGVVGRVTGKCVIENTSIANSVINAYVNDGSMTDQKRTVSKYVGNFYGSSAQLTVTDGSIDNVTINHKNDLALTQSCLYTEYLGGWRTAGGTVSINGIEITKDQTNEDITIDTEAELAAAISNATDGAVIPVSGEIPTAALNASGKNITIVGMSDDATINSSSNRMHTNGNITFQNLTVTLPTNNDYLGGHDANGGTMVFENCKFVGTATTVNGNFTYNNCEFTNPDKYAAWVYGNSVVTYNNCSFSGPDRAAKVYSDGGSKVEVTYNNCTFKATAQANKTAVEIDCTRQTSGVPYYVTIINPTIENMGVAEHYAVGAAGVCNLETSGVGLGIVNLDGKGYSVAHTAAQLAALTNAGKDVTVQFAQDIAGDFTYEQNENETVVIDGNGKTMNGTINVRARAGVNKAIPVVIKNINFKMTTDAEKSFILSSEKNYYPHITVSGCTFEGPGAESSVVPVTIKSANNFVMENCTATKVHSLIQNTSGWNITIRNCEVTESGRGMALGTVQGATIENVKIDALDTKYGIRMDAGYNNNATIKDCEISAFIPVVVRKASVNSTVVFNGTNTMTPANTDGLWCAIGTSEYEANGVMPTDPTAQVTVTLNDAGLNPAGVYGAANL